MMPSHQERVKQNYCNHKWPYLHPSFIQDYPDLKDGRKCIDCNIDWDIYQNRRKNSCKDSPNGKHQFVVNRCIHCGIKG